MEILVGTDIETISRFKYIMANNSNFMSKCFLESEINYCVGRGRPHQHFAGRFSAKEAFAKACGAPQNWHDVEIINNSLGRPEVILHGKAKENLKDSKISLSISHCREYATAVVIIYKP